MERLTRRVTKKDTGEVLAYGLERDVSPSKVIRKLGLMEDAQERGFTNWISTTLLKPDDGAAVLATVYHRPWIADMGTEDEVRREGRYEVCQVWRKGDMYIKMDDRNPDLIVFIPLAEQEENIENPIEEVVAWTPLPNAYMEE